MRAECSTSSIGFPLRRRTRWGSRLGLSSGETPDRFLVALATLSLLSEVAEELPLACFVDDAQWLDDASGQVLGFVARRLLAEAVALVFGVREPSGERALVGLPELLVGGLAEEDARALLATVIPGRLDEGVRDRIAAETSWEPAGAARAVEGHVRSGDGGRLRSSERRRSSTSDRGPLCRRAPPRCRSRRNDCCCLRRPIPLVMRRWYGVPPRPSGSSGPRRNPRRKSSCWKSVHGYGFVIRS